VVAGWPGGGTSPEPPKTAADERCERQVNAEVDGKSVAIPAT